VAAAHRALQDEARGKMVTKNLHSELVHTLSGAHHVRARVTFCRVSCAASAHRNTAACTHNRLRRASASSAWMYTTTTSSWRCSMPTMPRFGPLCLYPGCCPAFLTLHTTHATHNARTRHVHNRQLERLKGLVQGKETEVDQFKKHTVITKALQVLLLCSAPYEVALHSHLAFRLCFTSTTRSATTRRR
jgi:hypothetical protein